MITRNREMEQEVRPNMRGGTGSVTLEHWFRPSDFGAPVRLCTRMTLEPGASIGEHAHPAEDEVYLILSGTGRIREAGQWVPVGPGDAILTGRGGSHAVENDGTAPLVIAALIMLYTPERPS